MQYQEKKFNLQGIDGLSERQISEHLKLYAGYVKNCNLLWSEIVNLEKELDKNALYISELQRRFGFEFNGMRLHEYYFESLGSPSPIPTTSPLKNSLASQYGSFDNWLTYFKKAGLMRGIGWVILYYDPMVGALHNTWVSDHEIGHLAGLPIILAMDVWEHAYLIDYAPSGRKDYIEVYIKNLNWTLIEERYKIATHGK